MRRPLLPTTTGATAVALAIVAVGGVGVGAAVTKKPPTYKACASSKNVLTLLGKNGKCPKGTHAVSLGAQGPAGATGVTGPKGDTGAKGDAGPGQVITLHYEGVPDASLTTSHAMGASVNGVVFSARCSGTSPVSVELDMTPPGAGVEISKQTFIKGTTTVNANQGVIDTGGNSEMFYSSASDTYWAMDVQLLFPNGMTAAGMVRAAYVPTASKPCQFNGTMTIGPAPTT